MHQAVTDYWTALRRCQQRPSSCKPATFTAEQGGQRVDITSAVGTMVSNGWYRANVTGVANAVVARVVDRNRRPIDRRRRP